MGTRWKLTKEKLKVQIWPLQFPSQPMCALVTHIVNSLIAFAIISSKTKDIPALADLSRTMKYLKFTFKVPVEEIDNEDMVARIKALEEKKPRGRPKGKRKKKLQKGNFFLVFG